MAYQWATWLPPVLRGAGCAVVEHAGWQSRGLAGGVFLADMHSSIAAALLVASAIVMLCL
jgi:hypothetical protein